MRVTIFRSPLTARLQSRRHTGHVTAPLFTRCPIGRGIVRVTLFLMKIGPPLALLAVAFTLGVHLAAAAPQPPAGDARPPGEPKHPPHHRPGSAIARALDTNKDHVLSAAEIAAAPASLRALDANGDGILTRDELRPKPPADLPPPPDAPPPPDDANVRHRPIDPLLLALDANADGNLGAGEIANASASLLALDTNKDGQLTRDELRPLPPEAPPTTP